MYIFLDLLVVYNVFSIYVYVCVYVCMHECMYVRMYTRVFDVLIVCDVYYIHMLAYIHVLIIFDLVVTTVREEL